ncbi:hypothetical protein EYF80_045409 [Liparis tanakae]|uniref:Uncharacterized protein n=1 Tax=Liparis tanakae TaxID=230148 RepID=A0A4Z2FVM5_9TELE|nr:hypothetical protein EYF80_045409 [Liparis tanakae]
MRFKGVCHQLKQRRARRTKPHLLREKQFAAFTQAGAYIRQEGGTRWNTSRPWLRFVLVPEQEELSWNKRDLCKDRVCSSGHIPQLTRTVTNQKHKCCKGPLVLYEVTPCDSKDSSHSSTSTRLPARTASHSTASHSTARWTVGERRREAVGERERLSDALQPEESHEVTLQGLMPGPLLCKACAVPTYIIRPDAHVEMIRQPAVQSAGGGAVTQLIINELMRHLLSHSLWLGTPPGVSSPSAASVGRDLSPLITLTMM